MMKISFTNIMAYIQGNIRYKLYYSRFRFLIRLHIREQIDLRIRFMDKECYENGSCKLCGCSTTALQMADKQCDKPCYPPMMNKEDWIGFKKGSYCIYDRDYVWSYNPGIYNELIALHREIRNEWGMRKKAFVFKPQNTLV